MPAMPMEICSLILELKLKLKQLMHTTMEANAGSIVYLVSFCNISHKIAHQCR